MSRNKRGKQGACDSKVYWSQLVSRYKLEKKCKFRRSSQPSDVHTTVSAKRLARRSLSAHLSPVLWFTETLSEIKNIGYQTRTFQYNASKATHFPNIQDCRWCLRKNEETRDAPETKNNIARRGLQFRKNQMTWFLARLLQNYN